LNTVKGEGGERPVFLTGEKLPRGRKRGAIRMVERETHVSRTKT